MRLAYTHTHTHKHTHAIQQFFSFRLIQMQKKANEAKEKPTDMCSQDASCSCCVISVFVVVVVPVFILVSMHVCAYVGYKYGTPGCPRQEQKQTFQLASVCRAPFVYKFNLS